MSYRCRHCFVWFFSKARRETCDRCRADGHKEMPYHCARCAEEARRQHVENMKAHTMVGG